VLAADKAAAKIVSGDYAGAIVDAGLFGAGKILQSTAPGSTLAASWSVASLAALPIELAIESVVVHTERNAINYQIRRYTEARKYLPHDTLLRLSETGRDDDMNGIYFERGWLLRCGDVQPKIGAWEPRSLRPTQVFELGSGVVERKAQSDRVVTEKKRLEQEFEKALQSALSGPAASRLPAR
jgi:hypothetical protein